MVATDAVTPARPWRTDLRAIAWRVAVGLGAGSLVGYVVAGPLARLLMLALRLTSPDSVRGVTSDDGFTIGVFSTDSFFLLTVCGGLSAVAGIAYACFRAAVPQARTRLALWTVLCSALAGAGLVRTDGVDFVLLRPTALAVGGFIALPAVTGLLIGLLVDRWSGVTPGRNRAVGMLAPGLLAPPAILAAAGVGLVWLLLKRVPGGALARAARVGAPAVAVAVIAAATVDLARDIGALF